MGYAFINFIDSVYIFDFFKRFNGQRWEKFNSDKICQISYGRIQGKQALESNFSNMQINGERGAKVRPLILDLDQPSQQVINEIRFKLINELQNEDYV
jgi:hypothetical protein